MAEVPTAADLLRRNFDEIFIELDAGKREAMIRQSYDADCVWIHPGGRMVGTAAINDAATEIRKHFAAYRYTVVGEIQTMGDVALCRWGSGLPNEPFHYTGTDLLEAHDGRVARFYTFVDGGSPLPENNGQGNGGGGRRIVSNHTQILPQSKRRLRSS